MSWHQPQQWATQDNWIHSSNVVCEFMTLLWLEFNPNWKMHLKCSTIYIHSQVSSSFGSWFPGFAVQFWFRFLWPGLMLGPILLNPHFSQGPTKWGFNKMGPARDYCIGSNFWKFYLIRTRFTSGELVSLVKVFRLF
jgi:hypothetical protein